MPHPVSFEDIVQRARDLLGSGQRKMVGIAAAPGAGKSTLADALLQALGPNVVQVVPMDGFHLANSELQRLDRADRKGAPDTFDAAGYVHLLRRIRTQQPGETIYAPEYRRTLEEGVAGAVAIEASTPLIITEGNYLLMDEGAWGQVRGTLDETWFLHIDADVRQQRLLERHMRFGRSRDAALDWIRVTDEPNAQRSESTQHRANWIIAGETSD